MFTQKEAMRKSTNTEHREQATTTTNKPTTDGRLGVALLPVCTTDEWVNDSAHKRQRQRALAAKKGYNTIDRSIQSTHTTAHPRIATTV